MTIGITEAGDASVDFSWEEKLDSVDGSILITKKLTDRFVQRVLDVKNKKVILHVSCTGYGGTPIEKCCKPYLYTLAKMRSLIDQGWPAERLVLRIDPVIPTVKGIERFASVVAAAHIIIPEVQRVRVSVLDMYPHVRKRFEEAGLDLPYGNNFQASDEQFAMFNQVIGEAKEKFHLEIESCAETKLPATEAVGCVSKKDYDILGLEYHEEEKNKQRKNCLCCGSKKELLDYKWNSTGYNHCYGCLYCYWKTEKDQ